MTLYAIFDPHPGAADLPAVIPERFSLFAALLPPVFAVAHGLWLELALYVVLVIALGFAALVIGPDAVIWLYLLLAVAIGFAAPDLARRALLARGWTHRGDRVASSADLAQLAALETRS